MLTGNVARACEYEFERLGELAMPSQDGPVSVKKYRSARYADDDSTDNASFATHSAAMVRSFMIGKLILLPKLKLKAAGWFQPEDHASKLSSRLAASRFGRFSATALNYGGIYGSGVLLFEGHAFALRRLQERSKSAVAPAIVDEETAHAGRSALAGAFGGLLYALSSTPLVSILRTGGPAPGEALSWARRALLRPLRFTIPRDCGGFGLYFGTYTLLRTHPALGAQFGAQAGAKPSLNAPGADTERRRKKEEEDDDKSGALSDLVSSSAAGIASALLSGSTAGVLTYLWRSPWDTLYKKTMNWRPADAPLFSMARFATSPRGLKAVVISGCTWAVYEAAVVGVTLLTEKGILSP